MYTQSFNVPDQAGQKTVAETPSTENPELVAELRAAWEAFADELLPYGPSPWDKEPAAGLPD